MSAWIGFLCGCLCVAELVRTQREKNNNDHKA